MAKEPERKEAPSPVLPPPASPSSQEESILTGVFLVDNAGSLSDLYVGPLANRPTSELFMLFARLFYSSSGYA